MKLLRLVIPSALLMAGLYLYANAQVVPSPGPPTAIACAYNTTPVTLTNGQAGWVQCNNAGALQVNASVSASVSGFAPAGTFATLTATGSSASVALPAGTVVLFQNTGTTAVSCTLGVGSATALVSENIIQPASWLGVTVGANTFGACIDQTGSASNVVVLSGGAGLPTGAGGGSSGGGGGGAVTVADGADVAQGTTTDAACAGDATSGCTELSRLSRIAARLTTLITNLGSSNANGQAAKAASSPVVLASDQTAADPCMFQAKTNLPISQNGTSSVQLIALSGSTSIYVCSLSLIAAGATTVALTTGTGSACVTGNAAVIGSTTANIANSMSFAANGGMTMGNGQGTVAKGAASSELCMILGTSVFVSGNLTYVQQ